MESLTSLLVPAAAIVFAAAVALAGGRIYRGKLAQDTITLLETRLEVERQARESDNDQHRRELDEVKQEHRREYDDLKQKCGEETAELRGRVDVLTNNFAERLVTAVVDGFERHRQGGGT